MGSPRNASINEVMINLELLRAWFDAILLAANVLIWSYAAAGAL
jgi:hypothetical protein